MPKLCRGKAVHTEPSTQGEDSRGFVKFQVSACHFSAVFLFSPYLKGMLGSHTLFCVSHRDRTLLRPRNSLWLGLKFIACRR